MRMLVLLCLAIIQGSTMAANGGNLLPLTPSTSQAQYAAGFSICQAVASVGDHDFPVANRLHPHAAATAYFNAHGITLNSSESPQITLLEGPRHGVLVADAKFPENVFVYQPKEGYLGPDQTTFIVEAQGRKFKVIELLYITHTPDYGTPECTDGFGIKELTNPAKGGGNGNEK